MSIAYRKAYRRGDLRWQKQREIDFYKKLDGREHFPNLIAVDEEAIYITDCYEEPVSDQDLDEVHQQLEVILDTLEEVGIRHRDITLANLCWKDGTLYLVDFGWSVWESEEDSPEPVPQVMREWMCGTPDREQAQQTMDKLRGMKS